MSFLPYRLAPSSILLRRNASSISVELGDVFKTHCKWIYSFWLFYFFCCYLLCIPNKLIFFFHYDPQCAQLLARQSQQPRRSSWVIWRWCTRWGEWRSPATLNTRWHSQHRVLSVSPPLQKISQYSPPLPLDSPPLSPFLNLHTTAGA